MAWSPSLINFTSGLWLDPSDIATGFQDSAGTIPHTAPFQPTGKRLDKSGRGNHVLQASGAARPEYDVISGISSDFFDGTDDGYSTATFSAGTLTADMDCFFAIRRSDAGADTVITETPADALQFFCNYSPAHPGTAVAGAGTAWSHYVNGVAVGGVNSCTAGQLETALGSSSWKVLEVRNLNLSAWLQFTVGLYVGGMFSGDMGGLIVCPAQSTANRNNLRRWLGAKVGLSL